MIIRIERLTAHLFGWHTPACLGDSACYGGPGSVEVNDLAWHRWINGRGRPRRRRVTYASCVVAQAIRPVRAGLGRSWGRGR